MKNFVSTFLVLFTLFLIENLAHEAESYIAYIEERSRDVKFVGEYTKWTSGLLSQPDYLYGVSHVKFPCSINKSDADDSISTSVHTLRPSDVKCIAAMGDDFTTGLGARGTTPIDLLFEDRGISWSIGGDYSYAQISTIPNILREYNATIQGFSTKGYIMSAHSKQIRDNQLNVARSGAHSSDMSSQVDQLLSRLQNNPLCSWEDDWKMITIFVGANDLCNFCEDTNGTKYTPERYLANIRLALDKLYNASIPRTLVNLVLPPDVRGLKEYSNDSYVCQTLLQKICPCAAFPTAEQAKTLDDYILRYQELLRNLTSSGLYEGRNDFTVVIQPFMAKNPLPYKSNNKTDFSYLSPDCFHWSGKGHSQAAISLWNNMFEPVGMKGEIWFKNESLKCPTADHPYIFTSKNSAKTVEATNRSSTVNTNNSTSIVITTNNSTTPLNDNRTYTSTSTSMIDSSDDNTTALLDTKQPKNKKSKINSSLNKAKLLAITGFSLIIIMILLVGLLRRQKRRSFIIPSQQGSFNRLSEESEDDLEVYTRPTQQSDHKIPPTHGSRISFD